MIPRIRPTFANSSPLKDLFLLILLIEMIPMTIENIPKKIPKYGNRDIEIIPRIKEVTAKLSFFINSLFFIFISFFFII